MASEFPRDFTATANPAGVACVISAVVTSPVFHPASAKSGNSGVSSLPSGSTFTAPLTTREPLPHADDAAELSVTAEFSERVFIKESFAAGCLKSCVQVSGFFRVICESKSAHVSVPTLIPSLTTWIIFFGFCPAAASSASADFAACGAMPTAAAAVIPDEVRKERLESGFMLLEFWLINEVPFS